MDIREKLVELLMQVEDNMCDDCGREPVGCTVVAIADYLLANGVTVQETAYWTEVVSAGDKICAYCSNCFTGHEAPNYAALAIGHRHCRWCGARMTHQPPKGE